MERQRFTAAASMAADAGKVSHEWNSDSGWQPLGCQPFLFGSYLNSDQSTAQGWASSGRPKIRD